MIECGPRRGSAVEAWIKSWRDAFADDESDLRWQTLDDMLDDYREHADTNTPLDKDVVGLHGDES